MTAQLSQPVEFVWGAAVGIGIVVILCLVVLLGLLLSLLKDIDVYIAAVAEEAAGLARNTATSPLLNGAVREIEALSGELGAHVEMVKAVPR